MALIRYRFDTAEQLAGHLHLVDKASLLFLPGLKKLAGPSERVVVELVVREPAIETAVRGAIVSRAEGQITGSWLQLSDTRLALRLRSGGGFAGHRTERVSADQLAQLRDRSGDQFIAQILDVSGGGIRVYGARGLRVGASYDVRLMGEKPGRSDLGMAQVARLEGAEAGLRFALPQSPVVLRFLQSLRESWAKAQEIVHRPGCCAHGPIEPALPKLHKPTSR